MAAMLCDVVRRRRRRRRRRWAHAPVIHAASHFDHKKRVAWVPISMHTCGSFFYNYGAPLGGPSGRRSSAKTYNNKTNYFIYWSWLKDNFNIKLRNNVTPGSRILKSLKYISKFIVCSVPRFSFPISLNYHFQVLYVAK